MMFENILCPSDESSASVRDLFCSAVISVLAFDSREVECTGESGTNRPVERQINAEVEDETLIWVEELFLVLLTMIGQPHRLNLVR